MIPNNYILSLLLVTPLFAACIGDTADADADATPVSSIDSAIATCDCPDPSAELVSFNPGLSGLSSENVQDAIDEVAVSIPVDIASRITVETVTRDDITTIANVGVSCGGGEGDFIALGGSCHTTSGGMTLTSTRLTSGGMVCNWDKIGASVATATATVTCLDLRTE